MKKTLRNIITAGAIGLASLLPMQKAKAQFPFFVGQRTPTTYALENRTMVGSEDPKFNDIFVVKTFRKEIPVWAYVGTSYNNENNFGDVFYGAGPILNFKDRLYMLPTVEGSGKEFSGVTFHSTLLLGRNWHVDVNPQLNKDLRYSSTPFNVGKTYKGFTFGISSDFDDLEDITLRVARVKKGNFIDVGFNPKNKRFRISFQKAF